MISVKVSKEKLQSLLRNLPDEAVRILHDGVNYGVHQEFGAGPHEIRPREAKALYWPGAEHPVAVVHHPGNPPHPFMTPAVEGVRDELIQGMRQVVERQTMTADRFVETVARHAQALARQYAPVDSGQLRNSIDVHKPSEVAEILR